MQPLPSGQSSISSSYHGCKKGNQSDLIQLNQPHPNWLKENAWIEQKQ